MKFLEGFKFGMMATGIFALACFGLFTIGNNPVALFFAGFNASTFIDYFAEWLNESKHEHA